MSHNDDISKDGFEYFAKTLKKPFYPKDFPRYIHPRDVFLNNDPLIDSPAVVGVAINDTITELTRKITEDGETTIINACRAGNVDPDALIRTAQKNAELQERLKTIRDETRRETIKEIMRCLEEYIEEGL